MSREFRNGSVAMSASDITSNSVCCGASAFIERPGVCELSSVSDVASFVAVFSCETKVTCRGRVKGHRTRSYLINPGCGRG
jgi:hypothetical protein